MAEAQIRDADGHLEGQGACGHWGRIAAAHQYASVSEGLCPTCRTHLVEHWGWSGMHTRCPCCGECWRADQDGLASILHPPEVGHHG